MAGASARHPSGIDARLVAEAREKLSPMRDPAAVNAYDGRRKAESARLLADFKTPDDVQISLRIDLFQVIEQPPPATDHHQQTPPAGEILGVRPQVFRQLSDSGRENRNLDFGRSGIRVATPKIADQCLFSLFCNSHQPAQSLTLQPSLVRSAAGTVTQHPTVARVTWTLLRELSYSECLLELKGLNVPPAMFFATAKAPFSLSRLVQPAARWRTTHEARQHARTSTRSAFRFVFFFSFSHTSHREMNRG
jgi:hypothetical protein